ncbi:MAG TPA: HAMP domain-containing sensor histidine kinase [Actinocrinis sp.]|nr:HAMP domain-containing sensor histidine kinase [Actinocrinis sp.]
MARAPGLSVRTKLTLSYAGFLMVAGALLLGAVWWFLLRYVQRGTNIIAHGSMVQIMPGREALVFDFVPAAIIALAFLLVFGVVGGWLLAGRMLAPLTRITDATRIAAGGSLSHRIRLKGRRDEFRDLADDFDSMLVQLEAHVAEQRRFAANASHELRTPLAITQTLLDVARNDPGRPTGELLDRLYVLNTRAIDLTEALLLLSRADRRSFQREPVDLSLLAEQAAETLLPLAEKRGLVIETSGEVTPTAGSPALLLQMTTNLVHNAIVHNLPEGGTVWVTTTVGGRVGADDVVLVVENTGRKLDPQLIPTLVEPFQRASERVHTDHAGVGLGLAIVQSIASAHEGTLTLAPRPDGGLRVTVRLPAG